MKDIKNIEEIEEAVKLIKTFDSKIEEIYHSNPENNYPDAYKLGAIYGTWGAIRDQLEELEIMDKNS